MEPEYAPEPKLSVLLKFNFNEFPDFEITTRTSLGGSVDVAVSKGSAAIEKEAKFIISQ